MRRAKQNPRGWRGVLAVALVVMTGCAADRGPHPDLPPLGIQAEFTSKNLCSLGVSPEVRLGGVPAQTATYRWRMTNVGVLFAPRWQADVAANGPTIPEGAVADFPTPCPGELQNLVYRFELMALSADGRPLAYGWQFVTAVSTTLQVEREQARAAGKLPAPAPNAPVSTARPTFFTY
jgi:hypothetical protein